jgi:hypothetical protein
MIGNGPGHRQGLYFIGCDDYAGATNPNDKLLWMFVPQALISGTTIDPAKLQLLRQAGALAPRIDTDVLYGQVASNKHGELATGWARDFMRWHIFDMTFPVPGGGVPPADTYTTTFTINANVVETTATFLGGFATLPIDANDTVVFFHANPTTAYLGGNPYELKLGMETNAGVRTLQVTYGSNLIGHLTRIVLFFSAEYESGAVAPDEGTF